MVRFLVLVSNSKKKCREKCTIDIILNNDIVHYEYSSRLLIE